jgi:4-hydroxyphenylpyruvate dioxygenase
VATARELRAAGAPLLSLPANHVDDLAARFDLARQAGARQLTGAAAP